MIPHQKKVIRYFFIFFSFGICARSSLAHEYVAHELIIEHPMIRKIEASGKKVAGFVEIYNKGSKSEKLIGATLEGAHKTEFLYSQKGTSGLLKNKVTGEIEIKPGKNLTLNSKVAFILFSDIFKDYEEDTYINGSLIFANAGSIKIEFLVVASKDNN